MIRIRRISELCTLGFAMVVLISCSSTKNVAIETTFPVPLVNKAPVNLGIHLDQELLNFVYHEKIEKKGEWNVDVGSIQTELFNNLATGMFESHTMVNANSAAGVDAVLRPVIEDLQFSLPDQTRSNFYEVWIRYTFELYDSNGNRIGDWPLPAYGKASKEDFGSSSNGVTAAAIAACRDAMAFFILNFGKVPAVKQWLAAGMPQNPPPAPAPVTQETDGGEEDAVDQEESADQEQAEAST